MAQHRGAEADTYFASVESGLGRLSEALRAQFRDALSQLGSVLLPDELVTWATESLDLARCLPPASADAAAECFRATPGVLATLSADQLSEWVHRGRVLCRDGPELAIAYFQASPRALEMLPARLVDVWLEMGPGLYERTSPSTALASEFLAAVPDLLESLSLATLERLALVLNRLADSSPDLASECLATAPRVLSRVLPDARGIFLDVAMNLARLNGRAAARFFGEGGEAVAPVQAAHQKELLSIAETVARDSARLAMSLVAGFRGFREIDADLRGRVLSWTRGLLAVSPSAGVDFIRSCPAALARVGVAGVERWVDEGHRLLEEDDPSAPAHFKPESVNEATLARLAARVDLSGVSNVLVLYAQALAGDGIRIRGGEDIPAWSMGRIQSVAEDGCSSLITLPPMVGRYGVADDNFAWYKVAVTHQAGHIEFGSFDFSFARKARLFSDRRHELPAIGRAGDGATDLERFFDLFEDRGLAADLLSLAEDVRVDHSVRRRYPGIASTYNRFQEDALSRRPVVVGLPQREAMLEILVQASLGKNADAQAGGLAAAAWQSLEILGLLHAPEATVEDAAEAAIRLYDLIIVIPNLVSRRHEEAGPDDETMDEETPWGTASDDRDATSGFDVEVPYRKPKPVEFRGGTHPELLDVTAKIEDDPKELVPSPVSPSSGEVQLSDVVRGEHVSSGLYVTGLEARAPAQLGSERPQGAREPGSVIVEPPATMPDNARTFLYDEWDYQTSGYLAKWCRVVERPLGEGSGDVFDDTLARNASLAARIRRQFEMLAPGLRRRRNRLPDGEGLDLDAVINAVVERKAGRSFDARVYWENRKIQRDVAAVLLIDMSASTDDAIAVDDGADRYPEWYMDIMWEKRRLQMRNLSGSVEGRRRVIDVARDSVVLMMDVLEGIGDVYGVYGFSGYGRQNVELLVIKGIDEAFSETVKARVGGIVPLHSTRMGPAIRHATAHLTASGAATKILFLVSDGYPQDKGYGRQVNDREYALQDTRMAFVEAQRSGVTPFCLTVDLGGHDYLRRMAGDVSYEVVNDVEALPERLSAVYVRLTG